MSDIQLLSGISGLSFDSPFLSPLLFLFVCFSLALLLSGHVSSNGPFFFFSFSPEKSQTCFAKLGILCVAVVEQLGGDSF